MMEEGGVRQMEKARCGIGHNVFLSRDEGELGAVAVVALVLAGALAYIGCGP
jgi:hypothetical protein